MHTTHFVLVKADSMEEAKSTAEYFVEEYAVPKACDYYQLLGVTQATEDKIKDLQKNIIKEVKKFLKKEKS